MPTKHRFISPYSNRKLSGGAPANNPTVQAWLNKIASDGYTAPTAPKIAIYNAAWNYADAQGLTSKFDLVGLLKVENQNLCRVPFIHSGGASKRFQLIANPVFTANVGIKSKPALAGGYLSTNWVQSIDAVNYTADNGFLATYIVSNLPEVNAGYILGNADSGFLYVNQLQPSDGSGNFRGAINGPNSVSSSNGGNISGLWYLTISAVEVKVYRNNSLLGTDVVNLPVLLDTALNLLVDYPESGSYYAEDSSLIMTGSGSIDKAKLNTFVNMLLL